MQLFNNLTQAKPGCCVSKRKPSIPGMNPSVPAISDDTKSNAPTEEGDSPNTVFDKDLDADRKQQELRESAAISVQSGVRGQQSRKRMSVAAAEAAAKAEAAAAEAEAKAAAEAAAQAAAKAAAEKAKEAERQAQLDAEKKAAAEKAKEAALQAKLDAEKAKEAALQAKLDAEKKKAAADAEKKAAAEAKAAAEKKAAADAKAAAEAEKKAAEAKAAEKAKLAAQEAAAREAANKAAAEKAAAEKAAAEKAAAEKAAPVGSPKASAPTEADMAAQGVLRVHVISAKGIALDSSGGLPDSSAKIYLSQQPEEIHETLVQKGTASPEWGEQFDFHGTLAEIANKRLGVSAHLGVELNDGSKASLPFGNEVANGKLLEGRLNTQGTVKVFASFAPLKVLHSSVLYIKKTGLTNTRYIKCNKCTLSIAEGTLDDGPWASYRLAYYDDDDVEHSATVVRMDNEVSARMEFTIFTAENLGYSVRAERRADFEAWTDTIKKIVPPPTVDALTRKRKSVRKSVFPHRRQSSSKFEALM